MGVFSKIVRRVRSSNKASAKMALNISAAGCYAVEIVGESHYQKELARICGGKSNEPVNKIVEATLVLDDNNEYDPLAIRVDISKVTVGHLSKAHARHFRDKLKSNGHPGSVVVCPAKIVGGWDRGYGDAGYFGVRLDLPNEYVEAIGKAPPLRVDSSNIFTFELDAPDTTELKNCNPGDRVKLWKSPDEPMFILVYRSGSVGGFGKIGRVPKKYSHIIAEHMGKGLGTESVFRNHTNRGYQIECKLISEEETRMQLQREAEALVEELSKPYAPSKGFEFRIQLPKKHELKKTDRLFLRQKPIEYYRKHIGPLRLEFLDKNDKLVARKDNEPSLAKRLLRAQFSHYELDIFIISISKPDKFTLPYIDSIEARAKVAFRKFNN